MDARFKSKTSVESTMDLRAKPCLRSPNEMLSPDTATEVVAPHRLADEIDTVKPIDNAEHYAVNEVKGSMSLPQVNASPNHSKDIPQSIINSLPSSARTDPEALDLVFTFHKETQAMRLEPSWNAYRAIVMTHPLGSRLLHSTQLHQLAAMLSQTRPRTREVYLRLLAIVTELKDKGAKVRQWEWNALVHSAGSAFRKTRAEDFLAAMEVVENMRMSSTKYSVDAFNSAPDPFDIVTANTLLSVAARTRSKATIDQAFEMLLDRPHLDLSRITHLSILKQYAETDQVDAIPDVLEKMIKAGFDVGIDGMNLTIWAYARAGRLGIAVELYEALCQNAQRSDTPNSEPSTSASSSPAQSLRHFLGGHINHDENPVLSVPGIEKHLTNKPNRATYTALIQCLAYHGDLMGAISVFRDMISNFRGEDQRRSSKRPRANEKAPQHSEETYEATIAVYRALFIGYTRHAVPPPVSTRPLHPAAPPSLLRHEASSTDSNTSLNEKAEPWPNRRKQSAVATHPPTILSIPTTPPSSTPTPSSSFIPLPSSSLNSSASPPETSSPSPWTVENLTPIFDSFLSVPLSAHKTTHPHQPPLKPQLIYWVMVAFARTTANDRETMRFAWSKLSRSFGFGTSPRSRWRVRGRLKTLVDWIEAQEDGKPAPLPQFDTTADGITRSLASRLLSRKFSQ